MYSVDEVFMDISWYLKKYQNDPKRMATVILNDVLKTTGITATAGIGTNLYLAKIAMDIVAKKSPPDKNGVRIASLTEQAYKELLWEHQPLTDFWGIGRGISSKLAARGMFTMGDIAQTSLAYEDIFYKLFGVNAELIIDHAWGVEPCTMEDIKRYKPSTHSLSSGQVLPCNYSYEKGRIIIKEMVDSLVLEMMDHGLATNSVTLQVGYDRHASSPTMRKNHCGSMSPKPAHGSIRFDTSTISVSKLTDAALSIYARVVDPNIDIRRITITFANVTGDVEQQLDLFSDTRQQEKEQKVQEAMFRIKKKYGKNAVLRGVSYREGATMRERNQQIGGHKA